jgi:hypothetical protein
MKLHVETDKDRCRRFRKLFDFVKALPVTLEKVYDNWRESVSSYGNETLEYGTEVKEAKERDAQGIKLGENQTEALDRLKNSSSGE